jgi:hypothetical protein
MNDRIDLNQTQYFEIKIGGHLSEQRSNSFEGFQVTQLASGETRISGEIKDQSQLFGILIRIRDMGIPLLSVNILKPNSSQTKGGSK